MNSVNPNGQNPTPKSPLSRTLTSGHAPVKGRCRIAMMSGSGDLGHFAVELQCLLRYRLKLAALIFGVGLALFTIKFVLAWNDPFGLGTVGLILQGLAIVVAFAVFGLLQSGLHLSLCSLRYLELAFFGTAAVVCTWLHIITFQVYLTELPVVGWESPAMLFLFHLGISMVSLRWMILTMIYGTFIPNTWKRCATVVGFLTVWPVILTATLGALDPRLQPHLLEVVLVQALVMAVIAAIAVFGSYKIGELSQQAQEAKQYGQYRLKRKLGGGGMGEVHLAEHVLMRRPCAMKLIRPDQAGDPKTLSRFEREVRATAQLTHPNTVEIYDYGRTDDGTFYYVMEYLPGLSLEAMVEKHGPLPASRAVHFLWAKVSDRRVPSEPIPDLVPDLAVEVLSEGNTRGEMNRKLREYFLAGVRLIWFVDPTQRTVTVYSEPDQSHVVREAETLDGGDVLPGFSLPLRDLFARAPQPKRSAKGRTPRKRGR